MSKNEVENRKTHSSIEIIAQVRGEAAERHLRDSGEMVIAKLKAESDRVIKSRLILPNDITRTTPLWEVKERYKSYKVAEGMSAATIKGVDVFFDSFYSFLALHTIDAEQLNTFSKKEILSHISILPLMVIETDNIEELYKLYLIDRGNKESSVWQMMTRFLAFYRYCSDVLEVVNKKNFKLKRPPIKIKPLFTDEQIDKLTEKPKDYRKSFKAHRDWLLIMYVYNTGNRRRSVANIQIKDLAELNDGFIIINTTKNKKPQRIVIPQRLVALIREYLKIWRYDATNEDYLFTDEYGDKLSLDNITKIVERYCISRLGEGAPKSIHLLRHQYAAEYIKDEGSMFDLQKQLGHSTLDMVRHYAEHYGTPNVDNINSHAPINRRGYKGREKLKPHNK